MLATRMDLVTYDLLNCAPTRLSHHWHAPCAPIPSSMDALRAFFLSCVMLFQFNSFMTEAVICSANQCTGLYMITASVMKELKVRHLRFVCVLQLTIHPVPLLSFTSPHKATYKCFFLSFILNRWLHYYLYNHLATTLSHFLFCFLSK